MELFCSGLFTPLGNGSLEPLQLLPNVLLVSPSQETYRNARVHTPGLKLKSGRRETQSADDRSFRDLVVWHHDRVCSYGSAVAEGHIT